MSRARILAVDDQRYFRELVEGLLEDEGYEVQTAASGEEALHLFEREDFDVVLTDLVMPGIDGAELLRRIKERRPDQDVVMVTGVVDVKSAVDAMKLGATDYILKPFDRSLLLDSVDKILQRRRLREEHARLIEENLEFMGVLSLFERASGLFSTLSVDPLAERIVEGLCLETRAQTGVLWVAENVESKEMRLVGARGLVRVDDEPESIDRDRALHQWCPALLEGKSTQARLTSSESGNMLFVALRLGGETLGLIRLGDRLHGETFSESDRAMAEKFCEFGASALNNAMRFRALERRSLRDPETHAYTRSYFEDAVRNEIQKANRFGHRFSVMHLEPRRDSTDGKPSEDSSRIQSIVASLEGALRSTDLLASSDDGSFQMLLPQTDALGAGILGQRIRDALAAIAEEGESNPYMLGCATFPVDGTQLDGLLRVVGERVEQTRGSLLVSRPELATPQALDPLFDRMLEMGSVEPVELEGQILRFVLEDVVRRPVDRGVLFLSPGARWLPEVIEAVHEIRGRLSRTEIILLAEGEEREPCPHLTWVSKSSLDPRRPFVMYFGDGPAFAMVGQVTLAAARAPIFLTSDRALVEYLTFELQRELAIPLSV
jgi:DNA-binding response OmpR family regulator/GGDEF domain-containing protein